MLLLVFYPVVPLFAYLNLLWKHPKGKSKLSKHRQEFKESEYMATIAHSIAGGIESPIQFILQVNKSLMIQ